MLLQVSNAVTCTYTCALCTQHKLLELWWHITAWAYWQKQCHTNKRLFLLNTYVLAGKPAFSKLPCYGTPTLATWAPACLCLLPANNLAARNVPKETHAIPACMSMQSYSKKLWHRKQCMMAAPGYALLVKWCTAQSNAILLSLWCWSWLHCLLTAVANVP